MFLQKMLFWFIVMHNIQYHHKERRKHMEKPDIEKMASQLKSTENIRIYKNFIQQWGNTGTAFAGPGCLYGQCIRETNITILENDEKMFVFVDNNLCYEADKSAEIETDIAKGFVEGRYRAKTKYRNVFWEENQKS